MARQHAFLRKIAPSAKPGLLKDRRGARHVQPRENRTLTHRGRNSFSLRRSLEPRRTRKHRPGFDGLTPQKNAAPPHRGSRVQPQYEGGARSISALSLPGDPSASPAYASVFQLPQNRARLRLPRSANVIIWVFIASDISLTSAASDNKILGETRHV